MSVECARRVNGYTFGVTFGPTVSTKEPVVAGGTDGGGKAEGRKGKKKEKKET